MSTVTPTTTFSEGLVIGYFTLLGYAMAFSYEYSYSSYFGIPANFISVDISNILISIFVVGIFLIVIKESLKILEEVGLVKDTAIGRLRAGWVLMILLYLPTLLFSQREDLFQKLFLLLIVFFPIIEVLATIVHGRGIVGWKNKRIKLESFLSNTENKKQPETAPVTNRIFGRIFAEYKIIPAKIVISSVFFCLIAGTFGHLKASNTESFYALKKDVHYIIVAEYSNTIFMVPLNKRHQIIKNELMFVNKDALNLERLGLLTIEH